MDETPLLLACINRDTESRQGDASCVSNVSKLGSREKEAVVVPARCICDSVTVTFLFLGFHLVISNYDVCFRIPARMPCSPDQDSHRGSS